MIDKVDISMDIGSDELHLPMECESSAIMREDVKIEKTDDASSSKDFCNPALDTTNAACVGDRKRRKSDRRSSFARGRIETGSDGKASDLWPNAADILSPRQKHAKLSMSLFQKSLDAFTTRYSNQDGMQQFSVLVTDGVATSLRQWCDQEPASSTRHLSQDKTLEEIESMIAKLERECSDWDSLLQQHTAQAAEAKERLSQAAGSTMAEPPSGLNPAQRLVLKGRLDYRALLNTLENNKHRMGLAAEEKCKLASSYESVKRSVEATTRQQISDIYHQTFPFLENYDPRDSIRAILADTS